VVASVIGKHHCITASQRLTAYACVQVVMAYCVGIIACLTALRYSPVGAFKLQYLIVFLLGFCIYGPQARACPFCSTRVDHCPTWG
jgi:sugar phosphate permease